MILLLLTACASAPAWEKTGLSESEVRSAFSTCRRQADRDMRDQGHYRDSEVDSADSDPMAMADRENLKSQQNTMVDSCMTGQGFRKKR
ncbi:MAG: hypothetical protein A2516_09640 [Alphaproteobacteria bacterium RIFOXYD12_FULL_60_8]|nr:MAG: hypothetical protein A2516_09640 [Alphaproteobacteria bacterium RIFOXYD12_FULL_60_8]